MKAFYVMFVVFAVLLLGASIASAQDGSPSCSGGSAYDLTMMLRYGPECVIQPVDSDAAPKVAGLAKLAPAVISEQGWPGCPWGDTYDPSLHGFIAECFWRPTDNAAAPKTAGLAKLAPAEKFDPCRASENLDPLLDPQALACLSQPVSAAKAASKPAGLAAPAPTRDAFVSCGADENLDPLLDPQALACLSQPVPAAKAASKPAGLAAPAPTQMKFGPCGAGESPDPLTLACLR
jgi:hypothetical protein